MGGPPVEEDPEFRLLLLSLLFITLEQLLLQRLRALSVCVEPCLQTSVVRCDRTNALRVCGVGFGLVSFKLASRRRFRLYGLGFSFACILARVSRR